MWLVLATGQGSEAYPTETDTISGLLGVTFGPLQKGFVAKALIALLVKGSKVAIGRPERLNPKPKAMNPKP